MNGSSKTPHLLRRRGQQVSATVVFADVIGFSRLSEAAGSETAYLMITQLLRLLDGIARKHGGSIDKYQGDKLMAVFGYPVPIERAAAAACAAALEMRQRVLDHNREIDLPVPFGIHMGVNTGELVGGDIRGPVVREFHVLGDAVNTAARLNAKAPDGQIWVGARTYQEAGDDFLWEALEPLRLKGKARPVPTYVLRAARRRASAAQLGFDGRIFPKLIGRRELLVRLRTRVAELARSGRGGALLLEGEEGSGKSRLLAALGETEELSRLAVRQLRGTPLERHASTAAFAPLIAEWAGIDAGEAGKSCLAALRSAAETELGSANARTLSGLQRLLDPKTEDSSAEDATILLGVLRSISRHLPLLMVVEDLQWLDPHSMELLSSLLAHAGSDPILFLLTTRPGAHAAHLAEGVEMARLPPLTPEEARDLVEAALGEGADEETLAIVLARGRAMPGPLLLASYLAPALRSEVEQESHRAQRSSDAERRRAVVVFADLTGFTAMTERVGAEAAYPVVASCLQILDEVTREHGGSVDHYLGDCVMAVFGVPRAIEDAPRAALNAAIDMRRRIRAFHDAEELAVPIDVHTGVASGLGIAGDISGPLIREFAVMGDHVDRADALTHAAEAGQIFVDEPTWNATREIFDFQPVGELVMPGGADAAPVWELRSDAPKLYRARVGAERQVFSALVGRDAELRELRGRLARLAAGEGGVIALTAEAGIGKSRLLAELSRSEEAGPVLWLEGRAISNGRNLSYHPIGDLLRSAADIDDDDDEVETRTKLDTMIAPLLEDASDASIQLAQLVGARLTEDERRSLDALQGDAAEKLLRGSMRRLLRAASARQPLVIALEDFHWADLSSVELIEALLRSCESTPILFLLASRPGFPDTSGRIAHFARQHLASHLAELELSPLPAAAARSMVKNLFRGGDVPQATRAAIEARAQGNPFYIEEVVRNLVDAGAVEVRDGAFHATAKITSVAIPDTVQEAVMARVDRLDLARKAVLQAASVVGVSFHVAVLEGMLADDRLREHLIQLEAAEFIVPGDRTAGEEYVFKHPLVQEVAYDALLQRDRQRLHLAVAKSTETRLGESMPGFAAMLAFHFGMGRDAERAEHYLFRAGDEASRAAASNEALQFFQQASALYDELHPDGGDADKKVRLEKSLAIALMNRGRLIEAVEHFDRTTEYLGGSSPRGTLRMGASFVRNLTTLLWRLYLAKPYGSRPGSERERQLIDVMFRRAMAQSTTNPTRFFVDSTALLRTLSPLDPYTVPESAAIYSGVVAIFSFGGLSFGIGGRFLDVASQLAEEGAVKERVLYYRTLRFLHNLLVGDWSEAHTVDLETIDEGLREGRFWEASTYLDLDIHRQIYQGNYEAAWQRIRKLAEIEDLYGHDLAASARLFNTASLHVERREFDDALRALEVYYDEHSEVLFNMIAMGTRARVSALRGDFDAAIQEIARARRFEREAGRVAPFHASYVHSARLLVDVLRLEQAMERGSAGVRRLARQTRASRRRALATARKVAWRRAEALRLAGREAWLSRRSKEALDWWRQALDCATGLGARPEFARTLVDVARALQELDPHMTFMGRDAAGCLAEARRLFEELDLVSDLAETERAT